MQLGNPLSPLLFNICINDVFQKIKNESLVTLDNEYFFNAMNYADDLIIFSTTEDGLQSSLDSLGSYCEEWKLEVNNKKSNAMILCFFCVLTNLVAKHLMFLHIKPRNGAELSLLLSQRLN